MPLSLENQDLTSGFGSSFHPIHPIVSYLICAVRNHGYYWHDLFANIGSYALQLGFIRHYYKGVVGGT